MNTRTQPADNRSAAAVFAEARKRLDDSAIVPGTVLIHVADGLVTLTGSVERIAQRNEAERLVQPVIGSRRLIDCIFVLPRSAAEGDAREDRG